MSTIAVLAAIVFVYSPNTSCSPAPCLAYSLAPDNFSQEEQQRISRAFTRFNEFVGIRRFELVVSNGCIIKKVSAPRIPQTDGTTLPEWGGHHMRWLREIWIDPDEPLVLLERTTMHELGHASGMSHLPAGYFGIMSAGYCTDEQPCAMDWTWADRNECEQSGICSFSDKTR